jgi:hypothetical protein
MGIPAAMPVAEVTGITVRPAATAAVVVVVMGVAPVGPPEAADVPPVMQV